ncbi:MAG TPA: ATP-binding protein [Povalibacter sp.]
MAVEVAGIELDRGPSRWGVVRLWLAGLILYSACIWVAEGRVAVWINDIAWTLASGTAALVCFRTARLLDHRLARAWWLWGAGCTSWFIGQLFWNYNELILGITMPYLSTGQVFYSCMPLLALAAISQMPESHQDAPVMLKQLGNVGLVMCCLGTIIVLGLIEPALQSGIPSYYLWLWAMQYLNIAATFLYALYVLWTYRWTTTWGPMLILVIGTGIYAVSNIIYVHALFIKTYLPSDVINISWLIVFGMVAWAATERAWLQHHPYTSAADRLLVRERWVEAVIPALLIISMVVVAVSSSNSLTPRVIAWAASLFILFAVILGIREALIQSDAQRLNEELLAANRRLNETNVELRDSELRYRDLTAALEKRVVERTAQLERAYGELEGFSYAVAHDLKAPLRAINGFAHLLREELGAQTTERSEAHLGRIRNGALKMSALIDDLLSYAHIERRDLHATRVEMKALVEAVRTEFSDELQRCGVHFTLDVEPLTVFLDVEGLTLTLRNLLENAIKYSCEVGAPAITVRARRTPAGVLMAVQDNGIGFDMEYHEHIFKVFQRLHREGQYPGTGIGLALVRKAVERIGGRVWAESSPGAGATFYIELPETVVDEQ